MCFLSSGILLGVKAAGAYGWQPTTITGPMSRKLGALTLLDPSGPTWPVGDGFTFYWHILGVCSTCPVDRHLKRQIIDSLISRWSVSLMGRSDSFETMTKPTFLCPIHSFTSLNFSAIYFREIANVTSQGSQCHYSISSGLFQHQFVVYCTLVTKCRHVFSLFRFVSNSYTCSHNVKLCWGD